ncbi:hypothetical protein GCM10011586_00890 [Silvibacterium dinghuense]|nr:hypothetical protein GCM10011586_00890 [Silvibacterium dinghuense]
MNHVWSYGFVSEWMREGRSVRILNLIDEFPRECLLIRAERRWSSAKIIGAPADVDVMVLKGVPQQMSSDNCPEFVVKNCANGSPILGQRLCTSNPVLHGKRLLRIIQLEA